MNRLVKFAVLTLALGLMTSMNASASWNSCQKTKFIDVRGNQSLDSSGDGAVTIAEVAVANPLGNLGYLVTAVVAADPLVLAALSDPDANLTVFAPEDAAFEALPTALLDLLLDPSAQAVLTDVLLYHVKAGYFDPRKVIYLRAIDSLVGQELFVQRGRFNPTVNNSEIECQGVRTDNGVVWLIDSVLLNQY